MKTLLAVLLLLLLLLAATSCANTFQCEDSVREKYPNATVSRIDKLTFVVVTDSCVVHIVRVDDAYNPPKISTDYRL